MSQPSGNSNGPLRRSRAEALGVNEEKGWVTLSGTTMGPSSGQRQKAGLERDARESLTDTQKLKPGHVVGDRYVIISVLGAGGMGTVYEAEHVFTKKRVALKILTFHDSDLNRRLVQEAQALGKIQSRFVVNVVDGGVGADGLAWFTMELLIGVSLRTEIYRKGKLGVARVLRFLDELASGVIVAHKMGIVHRDLKPENIFIVEPEDEIRVLDFGMAKLMASEAPQTAAMMVMGTPAYVAPERLIMGINDHRGDVYSSGLTTYEMLRGIHPFALTSNPLTFPSPYEMGIKHVYEAIPPLHLRDPSIPLHVSNLVCRMLAKNVAARLTMVEVREIAKACLTYLECQSEGRRVPDATQALLDSAGRPRPDENYVEGTSGVGRKPASSLNAPAPGAGTAASAATSDAGKADEAKADAQIPEAKVPEAEVGHTGKLVLSSRDVAPPLQEPPLPSQQTAEQSIEENLQFGGSVPSDFRGVPVVQGTPLKSDALRRDPNIPVTQGVAPMVSAVQRPKTGGAGSQSRPPIQVTERLVEVRQGAISRASQPSIPDEPAVSTMLSANEGTAPTQQPLPVRSPSAPKTTTGTTEPPRAPKPQGARTPPPQAVPTPAVKGPSELEVSRKKPTHDPAAQAAMLGAQAYLGALILIGVPPEESEIVAALWTLCTSKDGAVVRLIREITIGTPTLRDEELPALRRMVCELAKATGENEALGHCLSNFASQAMTLYYDFLQATKPQPLWLGFIVGLGNLIPDDEILPGAREAFSSLITGPDDFLKTAELALATITIAPKGDRIGVRRCLELLGVDNASVRQKANAELENWIRSVRAELFLNPKPGTEAKPVPARSKTEQRNGANPPTQPKERTPAPPALALAQARGTPQQETRRPVGAEPYQGPSQGAEHTTTGQRPVHVSATPAGATPLGSKRVVAQAVATNWQEPPRASAKQSLPGLIVSFLRPHTLLDWAFLAMVVVVGVLLVTIFTVARPLFLPLLVPRAGEVQPILQGAEAFPQDSTVPSSPPAARSGPIIVPVGPPGASAPNQQPAAEGLPNPSVGGSVPGVARPTGSNAPTRPGR